MLISGKSTTASLHEYYNTYSYDKNDVAYVQHHIGEMLGLKLIFMDGGSGTINTISEEMIQSVSEEIDCPLIIGGGINTSKKK